MRSLLQNNHAVPPIHKEDLFKSFWQALASLLNETLLLLNIESLSSPPILIKWPLILCFAKWFETPSIKLIIAL